MFLKTMTSAAFAAACLTAVAAAPAAQAQSANPNGAYGSANQNQAAPGGASANWSQGANNANWSQGANNANWSQSANTYRGDMPRSSAGMGGDQLVTNGPQSNGVERSGDWSARQNVAQSHNYTRMLQSNAGFRHARMRKECGPITDAQLHANCVASFNQYSPSMSGSSTSPHPYRSSYGR